MSFLPVTGFSRKATPSTGIPQSSGRCCGARQFPSRASPKSTLYPDHVTLHDDAFHLAHVAVRPDKHYALVHHCVELFCCFFARDAACRFSTTCSWSMCSSGMVRRLMSNPFVVGSQFIQRTAHCMFDLGNIRILSCINPRVLSFRGVEPQFLRGIFFPKRVIMPMKFTSRSCVISFANLSADLVTTAEIHGSTSSCLCQWLGFPTLQWCTSTIFSIFLVVGTVPRQSSGCSARSLLSVLMTSSSSSPFFFLTSSISFQPTATPSQRELICHHFHQHGCSTRACMGPWVPSLAVFVLGYLGPVPGCFLRVHLFRVLLLTSWLTASLTPVLRSPAAIGFMFRAPGTRCRLLLLHFSFEPILGFDSRASPALAGFFSPTATFWSSSSPSRHFRAASCATSRLVCSSSSILW